MRTISLCSRRTDNAIKNHWNSSKFKVERHLKGKNINGNSSMFKLIADDIEGTLTAVRVKKSGRGKGKKTSRDETAVEGGVTGEDDPLNKKAKKI